MAISIQAREKHIKAANEFRDKLKALTTEYADVSPEYEQDTGWQMTAKDFDMSLVGDATTGLEVEGEHVWNPSWDWDTVESIRHSLKDGELDKLKRSYDFYERCNNFVNEVDNLQSIYHIALMDIYQPEGYDVGWDEFGTTIRGKEAKWTKSLFTCPNSLEDLEDLNEVDVAPQMP